MVQAVSHMTQLMDHMTLTLDRVLSRRDGTTSGGRWRITRWFSSAPLDGGGSGRGRGARPRVGCLRCCGLRVGTSKRGALWRRAEGGGERGGGERQRGGGEKRRRGRGEGGGRDREGGEKKNQ